MSLLLRGGEEGSNAILTIMLLLGQGEGASAELLKPPKQLKTTEKPLPYFNHVFNSSDHSVFLR